MQDAQEMRSIISGRDTKRILWVTIMEIPKSVYIGGFESPQLWVGGGN